MIKRILITLGKSEYSKTAIEIGLQIAKIHHAELSGTVVLDSESLKKTIGSVPARATKLAQKMEKSQHLEAKKYIKALLKNFSKKCTAAGIQHRETDFQGTMGKMIIHHSKFFDLVISGLKSDFGFIAHSDLKEKPSLFDLLDQTVTPILGIPYLCNLHLTNNKNLKVLICLDDSIPTAHALQRFIPLVKPSKCEVTLLTSSKKKENADYILEHSEQFLKAHKFININPIWTKQPITVTLKDEFLEWSDLIVLGQKTRKVFGFRDRSLVKYLINEDKRALFIGP